MTIILESEPNRESLIGTIIRSVELRLDQSQIKDYKSLFDKVQEILDQQYANFKLYLYKIQLNGIPGKPHYDIGREFNFELLKGKSVSLLTIRKIHDNPIEFMNLLFGSINSDGIRKPT